MILDQFSRQAVPFSTAPGIKDEQALRMIVEFSGAGPEDTVLDVACGGGIIVCAFARGVRHATGIDLTPAMIERARALQAEQGLANVSWKQGDVLPLPWPDATFSIVTSRFAFHHFLDPGAVLAEMRRVCAPGGRVVVVDTVVSTDPGKAEAFNRMEKLRDPSHVRALSLAELRGLFADTGFSSPRAAFCEIRADPVLRHGAPVAMDAHELRRPGDAGEQLELSPYHLDQRRVVALDEVRAEDAADERAHELVPVRDASGKLPARPRAGEDVAPLD